MKLHHLLWSPPRPAENWALTLVRVSGNLVRWVFVISCVYAASAWWSGHEYKKSLRITGVPAIWGIEPGVDIREVTSLKGLPANWGEHLEPMRMDYVGGYPERVQTSVFFREQGGNYVVTRVCHGEGARWSLGRLSYYSTEQDIIDELGPADSTEYSFSSVMKFLYYRESNLIFWIEQGKAQTVCHWFSPTD